MEYYKYFQLYFNYCIYTKGLSVENVVKRHINNRLEEDHRLLSFRVNLIEFKIVLTRNNNLIAESARFAFGDEYGMESEMEVS